MTVAIRVSTMDDAEGIVALRREIYPYAVVTPAALRHYWRTERPAEKAMRLVAEENGEIVALGRASFNTWTATEGATNLGMMVRKSLWGQGIGSRLYDTLSEHLVSNGATRIEGWGMADEAVGRFLTKRGFERRHELRYSHLDLTQPLPPLPVIGEGVRAVPFAQATPEEVFSVDVESILDEPGDTPADDVDFGEWRDSIWTMPGTDHEASTLVYADGKPAAYTIVEADHESHRIWSGGTGSLRAFRGRGLAKIAKSVALRKAADLGSTDAYTTNDEVNAPMLAINVWLGYKPCDVQWSYLKTL